MSFAITLGYIPALLAPPTLGALITPAIKDAEGTVITEVLTPTATLGTAFIGLAILALVAAVLSHVLVKMHAQRAA